MKKNLLILGILSLGCALSFTSCGDDDEEPIVLDMSPDTPSGQNGAAFGQGQNQGAGQGPNAGRRRRNDALKTLSKFGTNLTPRRAAVRSTMLSDVRKRSTV